jgi:hypothetical protein
VLSTAGEVYTWGRGDDGRYNPSSYKSNNYSIDYGDVYIHRVGVLDSRTKYVLQLLVAAFGAAARIV